MKLTALLDWFEAKRSQHLMYLLFYMAAVSAFFGGVAAVEDGKWPLLAIGMQVIVLGITALLRLWPERSLDPSFLDPTVMSSAFVYGGGIVLPASLWFAGRGRTTVVMTDSEEARMIFASMVIGLVSMVLFRWFDRQRYVDAHWEDALWSPSKVWIDFVIVPVSSAMISWLLIPQIVLRLTDPARAGSGDDTIIATLFLVGFVGFVAYDAMHPPDPTKQHVRWQVRGYKRADVSTV